MKNRILLLLSISVLSSSTVWASNEEHAARPKSAVASIADLQRDEQVGKEAIKQGIGQLMRESQRQVLKTNLEIRRATEKTIRDWRRDKELFRKQSERYSDDAEIQQVAGLILQTYDALIRTSNVFLEKLNRNLEDIRAHRKIRPWPEPAVGLKQQMEEETANFVMYMTRYKSLVETKKIADDFVLVE
jgi:hypothetical protein